MRIAIVNWSGRRAGGVEAYLTTIIPALSALGHEVAAFTETDDPADREPIAPTGTPWWSVASIGTAGALRGLAAWRPDVLYVHGLQRPALEARLLEDTPAVCFTHNYYGTCISGAKSFRVPVAHPCHRRFGWPCLLHYYPRRCGGLNPMTMVSDYRTQRARLDLLGRYRWVVTHSRHMEEEILKHGVPPDRVRRVPWCVAGADLAVPPNPKWPARDPSRPWHVVFLGRMDATKGGEHLLEALGQVARSAPAGVRVTYAGDGSARPRWERLATALTAATPGLEVSFSGWLGASARDALLGDADLLALPSVWPEPYGQVGVEAGLRGVPAAAFAVGGIPDWLHDGVNGHLAPGEPPRPGDLADAIVKCLRDPATHQRLRRGAFETARGLTVAKHLASLLPLLEQAAERRPTRAGSGP